MGKRGLPGLLLGLLCLSAFAAGAPPAIDDIVGGYSVSCKAVGYYITDAFAAKDSYKVTLIIAKVSDTRVTLACRDSDNDEWSIGDGLYRNGVLTVGFGNATGVPANYMETFVLAFSGTPGKLSVAGKHIQIVWWPTSKHTYCETLKGKMVTP